MSNRTLGLLLGESRLERKWRFISGVGILVLVTIGFSWYGQRTEKLVVGQATQTPRQVARDINRNRAILISAAEVTAILAMVASYAIIRRVVVKESGSSARPDPRR